MPEHRRRRGDVPGGRELDDEVAPETVLPADSGEGRRVVFSEGRQRVWLVNARGAVVRTYLVSGSLYDNLDPGTYSVYSRSQQAVGDRRLRDHAVLRPLRPRRQRRHRLPRHPRRRGPQVQSVADLGTPQSHGCIRQKRADAIALWDFAPLGTTVVVTD